MCAVYIRIAFITLSNGIDRIPIWKVEIRVEVDFNLNK